MGHKDPTNAMIREILYFLPTSLLIRIEVRIIVIIPINPYG